MLTDEYKFWSDRLAKLLEMAIDSHTLDLLHEQIQECYKNLIAILNK